MWLQKENKTFLISIHLHIFIEKTINQLEEKVKELFHEDPSGHDMYHLKRTLKMPWLFKAKKAETKQLLGFLHSCMTSTESSKKKPENSALQKIPCQKSRKSLIRQT